MSRQTTRPFWHFALVQVFSFCWLVSPFRERNNRKFQSRYSYKILSYKKVYPCLLRPFIFLSLSFFFSGRIKLVTGREWKFTSCLDVHVANRHLVPMVLSLPRERTLETRLGCVILGTNQIYLRPSVQILNPYPAWKCARTSGIFIVSR